MNIDLYLFDSINGFAGKWQWLDYMGMFFAQYSEYFLWLCLFLFLITSFKKYWRMVLEAFIAAVFTRFVLVEIVRWIYLRPRPFVSLNFIPLINQSAKEPSFPSGHASFYFALSTIVYYYNKKAGILFYIASFFIVISRVFTGVHWPSDILAGAVLGILMGWILNWLFRNYAHKIIKGYNNQIYEDHILRSWRGV
jgi:undecaprenyl-diphosphatase